MIRGESIDIRAPASITVFIKPRWTVEGKSGSNI